jgi:hypothetical protein
MARKSTTLIKLCVMGSGRNHIHITNNRVRSTQARCVYVCVRRIPSANEAAGCEECERATLIERVQGLRVSARYTVVMRLETLSCHTALLLWATGWICAGAALSLSSTRLSPENFLSARQSPSLKSTTRAAPRSIEGREAVKEILHGLWWGCSQGSSKKKRE